MEAVDRYKANPNVSCCKLNNKNIRNILILNVLKLFLNSFSKLPVEEEKKPDEEPKVDLNLLAQSVESKNSGFRFLY